MSYTYRFNRLNSEYNIDLFKSFRVLTNEFTTKEDICRIIRFFPTISLNKLDTIYKLLEDNKSIKMLYIPIIHQDIELGYNTAHFLIQQDQEDNGKYIFIGNLNYHTDDEIHTVIEEYFSSSHNLYYSTEQLLLMIDNQYIGLFCDIFDINNYYNESYNPYFENYNVDNTYFIEEGYDNEEQENYENEENQEYYDEYDESNNHNILG